VGARRRVGPKPVRTYGLEGARRVCEGHDSRCRADTGRLFWLGTDNGLYAFDGIRAVPWEPPAGSMLPSNDIRSLFVARDGALWIGTLKGLASWKGGRLTQYPELAGDFVGSLLEDQEGRVWAGAAQHGRICVIQDGKVECYGRDLFGAGVYGLYEDRNGQLWVTCSTGLWRWDLVHPDHYPFPGLEVNRVIEDGSGEMPVPPSN
jgi:ligand-binding sensor domain-containing protein